MKSEDTLLCIWLLFSAADVSAHDMASVRAGEHLLAHLVIYGVPVLVLLLALALLRQWRSGE